MRLFRRGDAGEPVRDIQSRLAALGFDFDPDEEASFGAGTESAVVAFQEHRGLRADGIVGSDTWRALVEAGYRLGDRLLYARVPMMRGDDVAELQRRLDALGFPIGKVDGIFGGETLAGLLEFQASRRLPEDGIAGSEVASELELMARATSKPGREGVRERQWLHGLPGHLAGQRVYVDPACGSEQEMKESFSTARVFSRIIQDLGAVPIMSRSIDTSPPARVRAVRANRLGVDFIVSFQLATAGAAGVFYFSSEYTTSPAGHSLAERIASRLQLPARGGTTPLLKDTRAPAVVVALNGLDARVGGAAAQGVIDLFAGVDDEDRG